MERKMKSVFFKIIKNNSYPLWHIQLYSKKGYFLSGLSGFKSLGYKSIYSPNAGTKWAKA